MRNVQRAPPPRREESNIPKGGRAMAGQKGQQTEHRASSGPKVQISLYKQLGGFKESEGVGEGR